MMHYMLQENLYILLPSLRCLFSRDNLSLDLLAPKKILRYIYVHYGTIAARVSQCANCESACIEY